ncbi:glycosyltransferase family 4 protein [Frondihabitans australicus]|uniref:Glycosyltransferase involved in cell wall biosynthesis n=1 Tax=Frondihabitans australicus TaxID=386892 RepID=A0A495IB91_9MICO|nr:glycosyltransferase family 4 protein [Frondihabitans australicus]RKR72940.1 glycosyltransferase involved in cell wall biosynthesis [Frondihabitans australicus]
MPTSSGAPPAPARVGRTLPDVRLYQTLRTAHLERAHELSPATILYGVRRYDFDEDAARGLDLVQASGLKSALLLLRSPVRRIEINEPLMLSSLPSTAWALAALSLRGVLRRGRAQVVTYCIGNTDPFRQGPRRGGLRGLRTRLRRALDRVVARRVWARVDRVVFGTPAARDVYGEVLGRPPRAEVSTILALSTPHPVTAPEAEQRPLGVTFLGALMERKGVRVLLAAWPLVRERVPGATLLVLGKGPLEGEMREVAAGDGSIEVLVDPARRVIHEQLARTAVLALPSQPSPTWREQIGLPIVEALSHGCRVVATDETGLASWLRESGHRISEPATSPEALAAAIVASLEGGPSRAEVLATLPPVDARLLADDFLFERVREPVAS